MSNPRKMMLFNSDEATSVTTVRNDVAKDSSIKNVFGIDLGTTNSAISIVKTGDPEIIHLNNGRDTLPSCVMWKDGKFIVGDEAYNNKGLSNVQYSVKRLMEDPSATVTFKDGENEKVMTPTEVSAEILKGIVRATDGLYGTVHDVVVTVPAYFNDIGKRNTMKACELAGLNLIALENEPSAAALDYTPPADRDTEDVIIYDLGGGTFDITLASIIKSKADDFDAYEFDNTTKSSASKIIKPLALGGDGHLGGDDIDDELLKIVLKKMGIDQFDLSERERKIFTARLERLKKAGIDQTYESEFEGDLLDGTHFSKKVIIGPDDFEAATLPIYKKTRKIMNSVLAEVPNSAAKILLVGGSTKNPIIREMLKKDYPEFELSSALNPDLVVATGAAVKGRIMKYGDSNIASFDILPMTIGVLEGSNTIIPVIEKNEELPVSKSRQFTTQHDDQTEMRVAIYQGNSLSKLDCVYLGDLIITNIPKAKAGVPYLSVTLTITANNVLMCEATIDGITKTLQLCLNSDTTNEVKEYSKDDKIMIRWRAYAQDLGGESGAKLNDLLDQYPISVTKDEIKAFIRSTREGK
jgi:molecular chaperone DnaK